MADRHLRRHLSQDEMNSGIGMLHSGLSQRHAANVLGVSQSVVSRMWNRFITTENVRHLHAGGREHSTNCYVHTQLFLALYMCVFIFGFPCGYF